VDKKTINGKTFSYCFIKSGEHIITGRFTDKSTSCVNTQSFYVTAHEKPMADFNWLPEKPIEGLEEVLFLNASSGAQQEKFSWLFMNNNGYKSSQENTSYFFNEAGQYPVAFMVTNVFGCADTVVKQITIEPDFNFYIPNTFTPNGDDRNDVFMPLMRGVKMYAMMVFDRWGEKIFSTEDPLQGWDGTYRGEFCKEDVYGWRAVVSTVHGERKEFSGHVTLMR
jgi:gliding motility-associated-like protein